MAQVSGSFNVVGGSGNYRVSILECTDTQDIVAYTDLTGQLSNGNISYTITTPSPINISYSIHVSDLVVESLFKQTTCSPLVCNCTGLTVSGISGTDEGIIYTTYNYTPNIALGSSPITHSWTITGGATISGAANLSCGIVFTTPGTYTLTYNGENPCGSATFTKTIVISASCLDPTPAIALNVSTSSICGTETSSITASGCTGTVVWSNTLGTPVTNPNVDNTVFIIDASSPVKTLKARCFNCNGSSAYSNVVTVTYTGLCTEINGIIGSSSC